MTEDLSPNWKIKKNLNFCLRILGGIWKGIKGLAWTWIFLIKKELKLPELQRRLKIGVGVGLRGGLDATFRDVRG